MVSHSKYYFSLALIVCAKSTKKIVVHSLGLLWRSDRSEKHVSAGKKALHWTGSAVGVRGNRRGRQMLQQSCSLTRCQRRYTVSNMDMLWGISVIISPGMNISDSHWWREATHLVEVVLVAVCLTWLGRAEAGAPSTSKCISQVPVI